MIGMGLSMMVWRSWMIDGGLWLIDGRSPRSVQFGGVKNPVFEGDVGFALVINLALDQFAFDVEVAFGLAEPTAEGLPILKAGVHLVVCFDHADETEVLPI